MPNRRIGCQRGRRGGGEGKRGRREKGSGGGEEGRRDIIQILWEGLSTHHLEWDIEVETQEVGKKKKKATEKYIYTVVV